MNEPASASRGPLIIAFLIGGFSLVGLSIFSQQARRPSAVVVPARTLVAQTTSQDSPRIQFTTDADLKVTSMGWMAGNLHLHILLDSVSHMPGTRDLSSQGGTAFQWAMPPIPAGVHELGLYWADASHRALGDTVRSRITVE